MIILYKLFTKLDLAFLRMIHFYLGDQFEMFQLNSELRRINHEIIAFTKVNPHKTDEFLNFFISSSKITSIE